MSGAQCQTSQAAHETLMLGCSAQEAAYSAILWDGVSKAECEATTHRLCSEADTAWKEKHGVMYNHQLQYDQQLSTFLTNTETTLNNMRGEIWAAIHALAENEGITFNACLGLTLQVLNLLLQIPIDILFQTQILLTIAYCPESSEDGAQSRVVFHLSARKSGHPTSCPKSWAGSAANQARVWIVPHFQLLLTTPQDQAGCGAPDIDPTAVPEVSLLPTASNQALWAQWQVITLFTPTLPQ